MSEQIQRVTGISVTAGQEVDADHLHSVVVEQDLGQPDMAVITVRNDAGSEPDFANDTSHGDAVEVKIGDKAIFKGEIVGIEPIYKTGSESKVVIRAFNRLHRLLRGRKSRTFLDQSDQDIVGTVAGDHGLSPKAGSDTQITHKHVYQHNQTDLEFLRTRAARIGYEVWVEDQDLYFDKPKTDQDSGIELNIKEAEPDHGILLKAFSPRMSSAAVVKKVTVRGWNPEKKEEIVGEASVSGSKLGSTTGDSAASAFGDLATFQVDHPIFSLEEAKAIAESKLGELLMGYITGEGECTGNAELKPGIVVKIIVNQDKEDDKFNGKYLLTGCTHRFTFSRGGDHGGGGYTTHVRVSRDAEKPS